ncbi:family 9 carbohydrate esterase [Mycena latifolia]|nr:family 9 carbohydrate esterase [Mycena latifolia]
MRLSSEFKFPIASIHHTGETYLVPDLLKRAWGGFPAMAHFASNFSKEGEAYRVSQFGPRILADSGLPVIMKSDHPVLNSRYEGYTLEF